MGWVRGEDTFTSLAHRSPCVNQSLHVIDTPPHLQQLLDQLHDHGGVHGVWASCGWSEGVTRAPFNNAAPLGVGGWGRGPTPPTPPAPPHPPPAPCPLKDWANFSSGPLADEKLSLAPIRFNQFFFVWRLWCP